MQAISTSTPESKAAAGYLQTSVNTGTARSIELQAFQRVTRMLSGARGEDATFAKRAEAVYMNSRLWLTLATDLLSPKNQLPMGLRAQLFGLAEFSRKHGLKVLSNQAEIDDLIEINTAIMRGLRGSSAAETGATAQTADAASAAV